MKINPLQRSCAAISLRFNGDFRSWEERLGLCVFSAALLFAAVQPSLSHEFKAGSVEVVHPWSRETPAGAEVAAGYVTLKNEGADADRLVAATGEIAGRTEIHEMAVDGNGVMTMRPVQGVDVPAGEEVALKPGSFHIMFQDLKRPIKKGETFEGTLTFEKAGTVAVEFTVDAVGGAAGHDHSGHGR